MSLPPIHRTAEEWEETAAILSRHLQDRQVFAFGSRATGRFLKQYSDLDLAVAGSFTWSERAENVEAFDESLLPFKVDVVELDQIEPAFRARIQPDFIPLALTTLTQSPPPSAVGALPSPTGSAQNSQLA